MAKNDWAIIVAVRYYPALGDLQGAEHDADDFFKWVIDPNGGNVPHDPSSPQDQDRNHVELIFSSHYSIPFQSPSDAEPTLGRIEKAFDKLKALAESNRLKGKGPKIGRRLYLFFSGHGCAPEQDIAALLLANATEFAPYHFPGKPFANSFYRAGHFEEILLFMDCCQERPRFQINLYLPVYINRTADLYALTQGKRFYGFSAKWPLLSKEVPIAGVTRGAFTATLLEGLRGAGCEPYSGGKVTAASLANYLYENMKRFLPPQDRNNLEIAQEPFLDYDHHDGENFLITTVSNRPTYTVTVHLPIGVQGKRLQIRWGPKFRVIDSAVANSSTCTFTLERGYYLAQVKGTDFEQEFEVNGTGASDVRFQSP